MSNDVRNTQTTAIFHGLKTYPQDSFYGYFKHVIQTTRYLLMLCKKYFLKYFCSLLEIKKKRFLFLFVVSMKIWIALSSTLYEKLFILKRMYSTCNKHA